MDNKLNKLDFGDFDFKKIGQWVLDTNSIAEKLNFDMSAAYKPLTINQDAITEMHEKKERYDKEVLDTLKQIEGNTANLTTLVNLIQTSSDNQGEIIDIIAELLALAKEKDPGVISSRYKEIMNKITTFTEDVNTMTTLLGFGTIVLNILKSGA